jgi:hypothetical protein
MIENPDSEPPTGSVPAQAAPAVPR